MDVRITTVLENKLKSAGFDSDLFVQSFKDWKQGDEFSSYFFGKDGTYSSPPVNGEPYTLCHVHLVPIVDQSSLHRWKLDWKNKSRKTSDRVLVYVKNHNSYLLITILPEPGSHQIARMQTPQDKDLMRRFAIIAEAFIDRNDVIA